MAYKEIEMVESFKNLTKNIVCFFENSLFKESNLSCSELSVIRTISENEDNGTTITELAQTLKVSKSAVSQSISKLEKKQLVERKINLFDKKINHIVLTEKARKIYESKKTQYLNIIERVSEEMGKEDSLELSRLLEKLSNIINVLGKGEYVC